MKHTTTSPGPRKPPQSEGNNKPFAVQVLGVKFYLPYPRNHIAQRQTPSYSENDRVEACIAEHALGHEYQGERQPDWPTGMLPARIIRNGHICYMTMSEIAKKLHIDRANVTRSIRRIEFERGTVYRSNGRVYLVGDPEAQKRIKSEQKGEEKAQRLVSTDNLSPFVLPEGDPRREQWIAAREAALEELRTNYNSALQQLRASYRALERQRELEIAATYLGVSVEILTTRLQEEARVKSPDQKIALVSDTTSTDNLSPDLRHSTDNKNPQKLTSTDTPKERIINNASSEGALQAGGQATPIEEGPPASPPAPLLSNLPTQAQEQLRQIISRMLSRKLGRGLRWEDPQDSQIILDTEKNLGKAPIEQLRARIRARFQDIHTYKIIPRLAADCAGTVEDWHQAEPQPTTCNSKTEQQVQELARKLDARKRDGRKYPGA